MLESRLDDDAERVWLQIRIPRRPNGHTGWVREEQLSNLKVVQTHLTIDRRSCKATLRKGGKVDLVVASASARRARSRRRALLDPRAALEPRRQPHLRPVGVRHVGVLETLTDWPGGGVVGIHGTNQPELIPGRPSHGCVRVPNGKITRLAKLMPIGTPSSSSERSRAGARVAGLAGLPRHRARRRRRPRALHAHGLETGGEVGRWRRSPAGSSWRPASRHSLPSFARFALRGSARRRRSHPRSTSSSPASTATCATRCTSRWSLIAGQALLLGCPVLLVYAALFAAAVVAFVRGYEEPRSRGSSARSTAYRRAAPGWWPRLRPRDASRPGTAKEPPPPDRAAAAVPARRHSRSCEALGDVALHVAEAVVGHRTTDGPSCGVPRPAPIGGVALPAGSPRAAAWLRLSGAPIASTSMGISKGSSPAPIAERAQARVAPQSRGSGR